MESRLLKAKGRRSVGEEGTAKINAQHRKAILKWMDRPFGLTVFCLSALVFMHTGSSGGANSRISREDLC